MLKLLSLGNVYLKSQFTNLTSVMSNVLTSNKNQCHLILPLIKILKHFHFHGQSSQDQTNLDWLKNNQTIDLFTCYMCTNAMIKETSTFLCNTWQEFTHT